jgi:hypothetical protein
MAEVGKLYGHWVYLVYFVALWCILWLFCIFPHFGMLYRENLATLHCLRGCCGLADIFGSLKRIIGNFCFCAKIEFYEPRTYAELGVNVMITIFGGKKLALTLKNQC